MPRKSIKAPKVEEQPQKTKVEETKPPKVEEPETCSSCNEYSEESDTNDVQLSEFEKAIIEFDSDDHLLTNFLDDIRNANVSNTLQLNKDDFAELAEAGFPLTDAKRKLINCRRDIRTFLNQHPCCLSSTKDKMKQKILYYLSKQPKSPTNIEEE